MPLIQNSLEDSLYSLTSCLHSLCPGRSCEEAAEGGAGEGHPALDAALTGLVNNSKGTFLSLWSFVLRSVQVTVMSSAEADCHVMSYVRGAWRSRASRLNVIGQTLVYLRKSKLSAT